MLRRVLGGLSCRKHEAAAEAVPEAFGLARTRVSRRFSQASARELRRLQERSLGGAKWLVPVPDGKTFAGDQLVIALGLTSTAGRKPEERELATHSSRYARGMLSTCQM